VVGTILVIWQAFVGICPTTYSAKAVVVWKHVCVITKKGISVR